VLDGIESREFPLEELCRWFHLRTEPATPAHVLVRVLDRESVLLNLETEQYFGLDKLARACGSC